MNCDPIYVGESEGRYIFRCSRCGNPIRAKTNDPKRIKKMCGPVGVSRGPCQHLGQELRREECTTCKGKVQVKVLACPIFGECTIGKPLPGKQCCAVCPQWAQAADATRSPSTS